MDFYKLGNLFLQSTLLTTSLAFITIIKAFFDGHDEKHLDASKLLYFIYTLNSQQYYLKSPKVNKNNTSGLL